MTHARKQIRDAIVSALTGLVTTGANVFPSRITPVSENKLPALLIYTSEEASEPLSMGDPRKFGRTVVVEVQGIVQAGEDCDDKLDLVASEVEVAMYADPEFGGLVEDTRLVSTDMDFTDKAKIHLGRITLKYEIDYNTVEGSPDTAVA